MSMEEPTVKMFLKDAQKLNISWGDICDVTGGNFYAVKEGLLDEDDLIDVPISLIQPH